MNRTKATITLGVIIALLPVLGFPRSWETIFQVLAGVSIVTLSIWSTIDKKLSLKAKAHKRLEARKQVAEASSYGSEDERTPNPGRRITDFYPKTGHPGRRATDIKWTAEDRRLP